jgi:hypothetical protein
MKAKRNTQRKLHTTFVLELSNVNPNIEILTEYKSSKDDILLRCNICNHEWNAKPNALLNCTGCPVCSGRKVKIGINDLWTTHPDIANALKDKNLGYTTSKGSHKKVIFICPNCNK